MVHLLGEIGFYLNIIQINPVFYLFPNFLIAILGIYVGVDLEERKIKSILPYYYD